MIKVDKLNIQMNGDADDIVKEICYALVTLRFRIMAKAEKQGVSEKKVDSIFKMMVLGGVANSMSDDEVGYISEEQVAKKLHEITERAFENSKGGLN